MRLSTSMDISDGVQAGGGGAAPFPNTYSLNFDGVNDYVDTSFTIPAISTYSFSLWIKHSGTLGAGYEGVFGDMNSGGAAVSGRAVIAFRNTAGTIYFSASMGDGSANWFDNSTYDAGAIFDDAWHHIALTVDGVTQKLYIDGSLVHTYTSSVAAGTIGARSYWIGNAYESTAGTWDGNIDEVSIWNSTLSSGDVTTLSAAPKNLNTALGTTPIAWYRMGDSGTFNDDSNWEIPEQTKIENFSSHSFEFDGVDDYVDCGDSDVFSFGDGVNDFPFSVSFWIKWGTVETYKAVLGKDGGTALREWAILTDNSSPQKLRFYLKDNGGNSQQSIDTTTTFVAGQWYHITATYDGSGGVNAADGLTFYVDGIAETPTNIIKQSYTAMANTVAPFNMGRYYADSTYCIDASLDDVAVWDSVLDADTVLSIRNLGEPNDLRLAASYTSGSGVDKSGDLQAYWLMGENAYWNGTNWWVPDYSKNTLFSQRSFNFDGVDDYVDCGTISAFDDGDITFSLWCNLTDTGTYQYILSTTNSGTVSGINIAVATDGDLHFERAQNAANTENLTLYIVSGFTFGSWHHLAGIYNADTGELKTYVDGVLKTTTADSADTRGASTALKIGGLSASALFPTSGNIDEVSIFNSVDRKSVV